MLAWDVDCLVALTDGLPRKRVPLAVIREIDAQQFSGDETPTWRALIEHVRLIGEANLGYPIILAANGDVMDGMHRITKAMLLGHEDIEAVQFTEDPEPDHTGREPDELPC